jgi:hypothetical protein
MRRCSCLVLCVLAMACGSSKSGGGYDLPSPGADSGAAGSETPPGPTDYPRGPYGMQQGLVFPNVALQGYHAGTGAWTTIRLQDYYDPDGAHGIYGLYLTIAAPWCEGCVSEGNSLPQRYAQEYRAKGARFLAAVVQDQAHAPATQKTVDDWIATFKTNYDIVVDATLQTAPKDAQGNGSMALPYNYVIDTRTMRIASIVSGPYFFSGGIPGLDPVLEKNKK